jgi:GT2 family glycosyltransferase/glycosyltransferase involved in cell wall biosynthesis
MDGNDSNGCCSYVKILLKPKVPLYGWYMLEADFSGLFAKIDAKFVSCIDGQEYFTPARNGKVFKRIFWFSELNDRIELHLPKKEHLNIKKKRIRFVKIHKLFAVSRMLRKIKLERGMSSRFERGLFSLGKENELKELCIEYNDVFKRKAQTKVFKGDYDSEYFKWSIIKGLEELQSCVRSAYADMTEFQCLGNFFVPNLIDLLRREDGVLGFDLSEFALGEHKKNEKSEIIDVIVPVYKDHHMTLNCLKSLMQVQSKLIYNLVVINDCSPEHELVRDLRMLGREEKIVLIENDENLGFVRSVNKGLQLHGDRDVVILNSDTIVSDYWLDVLNKTAYDDVSIGTVTPFSNNASIFSYPHPNMDNELPNGMSCNELSLFFRANETQWVEAPTGHGFCLYIKRDVLNEVGLFDAETWGHGYCEENDLSLRAKRMGWRNVLAAGAFVQHVGSASFGDNACNIMQKNLKKLVAIYPDYLRSVQDFVDTDPVRNLRNRVSLEIIDAFIKERFGKVCLFVSHRLHGGIEVAIQDLIVKLNQKKVAVLRLKSVNENDWVVSCNGIDVDLRYKWPEDNETIVNDLQSLSVSHIHYHQVIDLHPDVWTLPDLLGVPFDFTVHDYFAICPRVNMISQEGVYCNDMNGERCNQCIDVNGVHPSVHSAYNAIIGDIGGWRDFYYGVLRKSRKIFCPSEDVETRVLKYFDLDNLAMKYNSFPLQTVEMPSIERSEDINIAIIGAIGPHKGFFVLKDCVEYANKNMLPIKFIFIGYTCDDTSLSKFSNVIITGEYTKDDLPDLVKRYKCHVAALLSVWPETYSYTVSEALALGLWPVVFDIGAQMERVRKHDFGTILPLGSGPQKICSLLMDWHNENQGTRQLVVGDEYEDILKDYYEL